MEHDIRTFDVTMGMEKCEVEEGALCLLKELRPNWLPRDIIFKHFTEGIVNRLVACYQRGADIDDTDVVLVRVYSPFTEQFLDRNADKQAFISLKESGCAPQLYAAFNNGLCYGFFPGVTVDDEILQEPSVKRLLSREVAKMHAATVADDGVGTELFNRMRTLLNHYPESLPDPSKYQILKERMKSKEELIKEVDELEEHLANLKSSVVLCHNDLLLKNIIYDQKREIVKIIDYEYCFYNNQAFDIGNHFCELAGFHIIDYDKYPDKQYQMPWLRSYLESWKEARGENVTVTEKEVETLYAHANKFALAGHMWWGLWALVQSQYPQDFDFLKYAITRLDEYFNKKPIFFELEVPS